MDLRIIIGVSGVLAATVVTLLAVYLGSMIRGYGKHEEQAD